MIRHIVKSCNWLGKKVLTARTIILDKELRVLGNMCSAGHLRISMIII